MAKSINVSGRMSVERFNGEFQKTFGVRCNVKISKWVNADGKATLASIRPKDFKGPSKVDLSIVGNMTVGTLKKRFEENFGVMIELYIGRKIAPDDVTIGAIREGRAKASKGEKQKETAPKTPTPDSIEEPSSTINLGIKHNVEINGDSVFRCCFAIDYSYYEQQSGDEGPDDFVFIYDFKNGSIISYDSRGADLDYVRVPHPDENFLGEWSISQGGDDMDDNVVYCQDTTIGEDIEGEYQDEMLKVAETITGEGFNILADKVLDKIK
jgi:hypothetical protein